MSKLNPILAGSAQSIDAYQQAIAQTSQAVAQWLQQPEMYQGKSVDELRERITLDFNEQGLGNRRRLNVRSSTSLKTACRYITRSAWRICTARAW